MSTDPLTETEAAVLAFEARWQNTPHARQGAKEAAAAEELGLGWVRYSQILTRLLRSPAARAAEPVLLGHLDAKMRASRPTRRGSGWGVA